MVNLTKIVFSFIQRCFTITTVTKQFLKLDFRLVAKILASSELNVTSELEIFKVVHAWIIYNIEERKKHAKDLLLKVRIPLLSENEVKYIKSFYKNENLSNLINDVLMRKACIFNGKSPAYFTNRYCTQSDILICCGAEHNEQIDEDGFTYVDGYNITSASINKLSARNLNTCKAVGSMPTDRFYTNMVFCKGELYFFSGCNENQQMLTIVEKHSLLTHRSEIVPGVSFDRTDYCVCCFMEKIYFMGGWKGGARTDTCETFDTGARTFKSIAAMRNVRELAACAVFNGSVVVAGGYGRGTFEDLNSVEAYDHSVDEWRSMPSMVRRRSHHGLAATRSKLFAVGGFQQQCEVFDLHSNAFALMKNTRGFDFSGNDNASKTLSVGNKVFVFFERRNAALCYDIDKDEWTEEPCEVSKNFNYFGCAKVPVLSTF